MFVVPKLFYWFRIDVISVTSIEKDTLEYQQTEKIETELKDVDRILIRKV